MILPVFLVNHELIILVAYGYIDSRRFLSFRWKDLQVDPGVLDVNDAAFLEQVHILEKEHRRVLPDAPGVPRIAPEVHVCSCFIMFHCRYELLKQHICL